MIVSSPGRICLFGEHQDYLGLPVIPCAISLRMRFKSDWTDQAAVTIDLPDIHSATRFELTGKEVAYTGSSDYFRSCYNLLLRKGFTFSRGLHCTVTSGVPINAGTSSSSALAVGWIHTLALMSDQEMELDPGETGELAYLAEVEEFGEHGGRMDQYSSAVGGSIYLESVPETRFRPVEMNPGRIILADSMQPKNTQGMLAGVRGRIESVLRKVPVLDLKGFPIHEIDKYKEALSSVDLKLLTATLRNRDITATALETSSRDKLGSLLCEEQSILRDELHISTEKIDAMVDAAMKAGAIGAKINGSGGGGCMFATVKPGSEERVIDALSEFTERIWVVESDRGVSVEV